MTEPRSLPDLLTEWKNLRSSGWSTEVDMEALLEKHADLEQAISNARPTNKREAFLQLEFLYTLWWENLEKPIQYRDYVWLNTFSNVLQFLQPGKF